MDERIESMRLSPAVQPCSRVLCHWAGRGRGRALVDGLYCQERLLLGSASLPLDGHVNSQAVGVGIQRAGRGDRKS